MAVALAGCDTVSEHGGNFIGESTNQSVNGSEAASGTNRTDLGNRALGSNSAETGNALGGSQHQPTSDSGTSRG
ncbi:hypothetical protein TC41_2312 [Alicyclobacillus acidocaldarius subsp. acidocaldarius Tc-4-1]|uniref:Uncharacterized protein n=1 Tax=Alicyclobacillus acidocaldarius (strain Tc-4-1) TaxID=1048834 RepID=F8IG60_ALIAT|nr:hypothetical protein TC41_2312 [Alicyclobacillus acidocaldarius subsp. acidocaldarius Tc-4-1]